MYGKLHFKEVAKWITLLVVFAIIAVQVQPAFATNTTSVFAPPTASPYGKSLYEWGVEWWRYVFSLPELNNPLSDTTGEDCAVGQSGPVFFLVGTTGGPAVTRDKCVVPNGAALVFPIVTGAGAVPEDGPDFASVRQAYSFEFRPDHIASISASVDGVAMTDILTNYHFSSTEPWSFTGDPDNIYHIYCYSKHDCITNAYAGYHDTAYTDGYWAFVNPLPPGKHTIKFASRIVVPEWKLDFTVDVTYLLTVAQ